MYERRLLHILVLAGIGCGRDQPEYGLAEDLLPTATATAEVVIDDEPVYQPAPGRWPTAALDTEGSQYLVVFEDFRAGRPILYGGRVALAGVALDGYGFPILDVVPGSMNLSEYQSAVAFDGDNFLVVTRAAGAIRGIRVSRTGEVLDPGGFVIANLTSMGSRPAVVFDGEQYMVGWSEGGYSAGTGRAVYRARVLPDATVLDPNGVQVSELGVSATPVALSFGGGTHLLSWADYDADTQERVLHASRIAQDGTLLDESPMRLNPPDVAASPYVGPAAAFDGNNHVVAWTDTVENDEGWVQLQILANRVTPQGTVLDPAGIVVHAQPTEAENVHRLVVTAEGGHSTVLWSTDYGGEGGPGALHMRAAWLDENGTPTMLPEKTYPRGLEATMASHAHGALLLWRDGQDPWDDYPAIVGSWTDASGKLTGDRIAPAWPASRQRVESVASDGTNFFVLWTDTRDPACEGKALFGGRVAADGTPLDAAPMQLSDLRADLADVVFDGANYVVTWVHKTGGEGDGDPFRTVRVSPSGELLDQVPLTPPLSSPNLTLDGASDGVHTLLIGADSNSWKSMIATVLLDQSGAVVSEVAHVLDKDQGIGIEPKVSFAGGSYLAVWHDSRKVYGQRISLEGALLGQRFIIADTDFVFHLAVSAGQGKHLVVWQNKQGIMATRVGANGQLFGTTLVASPERLFPLGCSGNCPAVAYDGEDFVVAWHAAAFPGDPSSMEIQAIKLRPNGVVSPQFAISAEPEREGLPFLAGGNGRVLAAYDRYLAGAPYDSRRALARLILAD